MPPINRLFRRSAPLAPARATKQRKLERLMASAVEKLEEKTLLSTVPIYVSNNWANLGDGATIDPDGPGPNRAPATIGVNAFSDIQTAIDSFDAGVNSEILVLAANEEGDALPDGETYGGNYTLYRDLTIRGVYNDGDSLEPVGSTGILTNRLTLTSGAQLGATTTGVYSIDVRINRIGSAPDGGTRLGDAVKLARSSGMVSTIRITGPSSVAGQGQYTGEAGDIAVIDRTVNLVGLGTNAPEIEAIRLTNGAQIGPATTGVSSPLIYVDKNTLAAVPNSPTPGPGTRIGDGIKLATPGIGTVNVGDGTWLENVLVNKSVTITGESEADVVIAPAGEDDNDDSSFGGNAQNAFLVAANGVTISNLTIDGQANPSLTPGKNNFRAGIITDYNAGTFGGLTVQNTTITNVYRRGIQVSTSGSGNLISGNALSNIGDISSAAAIAVFGGNATATGNTITGAVTGIMADVDPDTSDSPELIVQGNSISGAFTGISLYNAAVGTLVGGPGLLGNTINSTGGSEDAVGILVAGSAGLVTVRGNTITGDDDDSGIWLYGNSGADIRDNTIAGGSTGVLATDSPTFFGLGDLDGSASIQGNNINVTGRGVDIDSTSTAGVALTVSVGGSASNTITGAATGIRVAQAGASDTVLGATIQGNLAIESNAVGILVSGAPATITGNSLSGNTSFGILVDGAGPNVSIQGNAVNTAAGATGVQVSGGAGADIGDVQFNTINGTGSGDKGIVVTGADSLAMLVDNVISGLTTGVEVSAGSSANLASNILVGNTTGIVVDSATATLAGVNTIDGGTTGLLLTGASAALAGDTLGTTDFGGQAGDYVTLANGAYAGPIDLDASAATLGSLTPTLAVPADLADFYAAVDKITDYLDGGAVGLVRLRPDLVFVTPNTAGIQRGVNAADAADTLHVQDGAYNENVTVDKALTIIGGGSGNTSADTRLVVASGIGFNITAGGVTLQDLRVQGGTAGVRVGGVADTTLNNIVATGATNGVNVAGSNSNLTITNSELSGNTRAGLNVEAAASLTTLAITGSTLSSNESGIYVAATAPGTSLTGVTVSGGTTIANNTWKGAYFEKISDATFSNVIVTNNGTTTAKADSAGFDFNLKYGDFSGITINNSTFTNNGTGHTAGDPIGVGIIFNARNDGAFASTPASLSGVALNNVTISSTAASGSVVLLVFSYNVSLPSVSLTDVKLVGDSSSAGFVAGLAVDSYTGAAGGTLSTGNTSFDSSLDGYILNTSATSVVDGTTATYGSTGGIGGVPGGDTLADSAAFAIADKVLDKVDFSGFGEVVLRSGHVYVTPNSFYLPATSAARIQRGVDAADAGDTVHVQNGSYVENVTVNKALTIIGGGNAADETVVAAPGGVGISITASGVTLAGLRVTGAANGIQIGGVDNTKLDGIAAVGNTTGVNVVGSQANPTTNLLIEDSSLSGNSSVGFRMGTAAALSGLEIIDGEISGNSQGIAVFASTSGGFLTGVEINGTTFSGNLIKGAYFEKLSDALITNVDFINNGIDNAYNFNAGLDINLKYGSYSDITLSNATFTGNGTGADSAADTGNSVTIKARNDAPSYNTNTATLANLTIDNVTIDAVSGLGSVVLLTLGNDIHLGSVVLSGVELSGAGSVGLVVYGADPGGELDLADTSFDADLANYIVNSATGTTIDGTTATYGGVTGGDTLADADAFAISDKIADSVDVAGFGKVVLKEGFVFVTPSSYFPGLTSTPSIQRGIDTADSGDTVRVQTGTYSGSPTINKSLSLIGDGSGSTVIDLPQAGSPGANYVGALTITGAGNTVLVQGFTLQGKDAAAGLATSNVYVAAGLASVTITQNRFKVGAIGGGTNGDDGIGVLTAYSPGTPTGTLSVTNNEFVPLNSQGQRAFYINPAVTNFNFSTNTITGKFAAGATSQAVNSVVSFNTVSGDGVGSGSYGFNTYRDTGTEATTSLYQRNTFTGLDRAIGIFDANNVVIKENKFDTVDTGIAFINFGGASDAGTSQIFDNRFTAISTSAITNGDTGTAKAEGNWFGSLRGPTTTANPGGDGSPVGAGVDFTPWIGVYTDSTPSGGPGFVPTGKTAYAVPTKLVFSNQPSSTASQGVPFAQQPVVTAVDDDGVLGINFDFATTGSQVTLTRNASVGSGNLTGTATVNASNGVATFSGLAIDSAGVYTLNATDSGFAINLADATSNTITINFPTPTLSTILPDRVVVNYPGFTMTLTGTGFYPSSVVYWDADGPGGNPAVALTTSYVSATQLTASVPGSLLTTINSDIDVTVANIAPGGGTSNALDFQVLAIPTVVQVDDNYAGSPLGQNLGGGFYFGYNAFATIQDGIAAVAVNGTVNVLAGDYSGVVAVNKDITLNGANAGVAAGVSPGTRVAESVLTGAFEVQASGVTIDGFRVSGGAVTSGGENTALWVNNSNLSFVNNILVGPNVSGTRGVITAYGTSNLTYSNNEITLFQRGMWNQGNTNVLISGNNIHTNWGAMSNDDVYGLSITGNRIANNGGGIGFANGTTDGTPDLVITGNDLSGNGGGTIRHFGGDPINASGNWWGTTTQADILAKIWGGTGTGSAVGDASKVDFGPYLAVGTDSSTSPGFQPNYSAVYATAAGAQTGGTARIQEAIGLATGASPTVNVNTGTYVESVAANKAGLKVVGVVGASPTIAPVGTASAIAVSANGVTLENLAINTFSLANGGSGVINTAAISSLTIRTVGVTVGDPNGTVAGITITGQHGPVSGVVIDKVNASYNFGGGIRLLAGETNTISGVAITDSIFNSNRFYAIQIQGKVDAPSITGSEFTWGSVLSSPNTHGVVITGTDVAGTNSPTGVVLSNNTFNGYNNVTPAYAITLTDPANSYKSTANVTALNLTMDTFTYETNPTHLNNRVFDKLDDPVLGLVTLSAVTSQVVDNSSVAGFATSGTWLSSGLGGRDGNSLYVPETFAGSATATWSFTVTPGKTYRVMVTYPSNPTSSTNAPFIVRDNGVGIVGARINQRVAPNDVTIDGSSWEYIGELTMSSSQLSVRLTNDATTVVRADAVRIVEIATPPHSPTIIDNGAGGFSTPTGTWLPSGLGGAYGSGSIYAEPNAAASANWGFTVTPGKTYTVMATWPNNPTSATNSLFELKNGNTTVSSRLVNQQLAPSGITANGSNWSILGTVTVTGSQLNVLLSNLGANGVVRADAIRIVQVDPLSVDESAALPAGLEAASIDTATLQFHAKAAINAWARAGLDRATLRQMREVQFVVTDLPDRIVGLGAPGLVQIDPSAAGFGWSLLATPRLGSRLGLSTATAAPGIDLVTVIAHELGHAVGLADLDPAANAGALMAATIKPGEARRPTAADVAAVPAADSDPAPIASADPVSQAVDGLYDNALFGTIARQLRLRERAGAIGLALQAGPGTNLPSPSVAGGFFQKNRRAGR